MFHTLIKLGFLNVMRFLEDSETILANCTKNFFINEKLHLKLLNSRYQLGNIYFINCFILFYLN